MCMCTFTYTQPHIHSDTHLHSLAYKILLGHVLFFKLNTTHIHIHVQCTLHNNTFVPYFPPNHCFRWQHLCAPLPNHLFYSILSSHSHLDFFFSRSFVYVLSIRITLSGHISRARIKHTCNEQVFIGMGVNFEIENRPLIFCTVWMLWAFAIFFSLSLSKKRCIIFPQFICISYFFDGTVVFTLQRMTHIRWAK